MGLLGALKSSERTSFFWKMLGQLFNIHNLQTQDTSIYANHMFDTSFWCPSIFKENKQDLRIELVYKDSTRLISVTSPYGFPISPRPATREDIGRMFSWVGRWPCHHLNNRNIWKYQRFKWKYQLIIVATPIASSSNHLSSPWEIDDLEPILSRSFLQYTVYKYLQYVTNLQVE